MIRCIYDNIIWIDHKGYFNAKSLTKHKKIAIM